MSYRDPYNPSATAGQYGGRQYSTEDFNPYEQPRYNSYDQGGPINNGPGYSYSNDPYYSQQQTPSEKNARYAGATYSDEPLPEREDEGYHNSSARNLNRANTGLSQRSVSRSVGQSSGFDQGEFTAARNESLWKKGGRGRCACRFFGCTFLTFLLLLLSIIGALALWIRPPAVTVGDVQPSPQGGNVVQFDASGGLTVNLGINITVNNPNYFDVNFERVEAKLFYPVNNTPIGGGTANNVGFPGGTNRTWEFPLKIEYKTENDPNSAVLIDLGQKCGLLGTPSDIELRYEITVGVKVLVATISPSFSNSVRMPCPIDSAALGGLLGGGLGGLLGG